VADLVADLVADQAWGLMGQADLLAKVALGVACDHDLQIQPKGLRRHRRQQQARQERCKNRGRTPARRMADAAAR
jgi:hypothetical protein